ncbi:MAG TPA: hypothetical protein VGF67_05345 [Ktedonobacteraceae bacterium]
MKTRADGFVVGAFAFNDYLPPYRCNYLPRWGCDHLPHPSPPLPVSC